MAQQLTRGPRTPRSWKVGTQTQVCLTEVLTVSASLLPHMLSPKLVSAGQKSKRFV